MITTERNRFLAGHVTQEVLDALDQEIVKESDKRSAKLKTSIRVSRSQFMFEILSKELKRRGHALGMT
jgi:stress-induced morphogen